MKILIDNYPLDEEFPATQNFSEFCEQVMNLLLQRKLSIGSCKFDGKLVNNIKEADALFLGSQTCHIDSVPLAAALKMSLTIKCMEIEKLEADCETLVHQALLAEPKEIINDWQALCEGIKAQTNFVPCLGGLLTAQQVDYVADRLLPDLGKVMAPMKKAFNCGDTVEISDILELQLLPWLGQFRVFMETCLTQAKKLNH